MTRIVLALLLPLLLSGATSYAAGPVEEPAACVRCSMDRTRFAHSRMVVEYVDGSSSGVCSIHCAAADVLRNKGKKVAAFKVADYGTKELTDARKATWVVGGKAKGVMTGVPKWAFAKKADAQAFIEENGGAFTTFDKMLRASRKEALAFAH
ncbi:MAG TPA: nitrous oxide reductase accessory protein NosL [Candidatus Deferrimicrobiaceae bacterium]